MDSLLPATEAARTSCRPETPSPYSSVDDSEGGKYLYFSPGAFAEFLTLASAHGAQPCDRPDPEGLSLAYGDEWAARKLLLR